MKKLLATILTLSCVLALASCGGGEDTSSAASSASTASTAPASTVSTVSIETPSAVSSEAEEDTLNLAMKGTAFADSNHESNGNGIEALNDGDIATRWQSASKGENVLESEENPSWFGIQWDEAQTFDTLTMEWEVAHPTEDGFRIEISDDGEDWEKVDFESERTGTYEAGQETLDSDRQKDTVTLDEAVTTKYVRVYCFTYYTVPQGHENAGSNKSPTSCWEIEIYNSADVEAAEAAGSSEVVEE